MSLESLVPFLPWRPSVEPTAWRTECCSRRARRRLPRSLARVIGFAAIALGAASAGAQGNPSVSDSVQLAPDRYEPALIPLFSADTDHGIGFGVLGVLAQFKQGYYPFRFRLQALAFFSLASSPDGGVQVPFHNYFLKMDLPGLLGPRFRTRLDLSFKRTTNTGYYGLGNDSPAADGMPSRYHEYDRSLLQLNLQNRVHLLSHLSLFLGALYTQSWINVYEQSKLAEDLQSQDAHVKELLRGVGNQGAAELSLGWLWDSRDHEFSPTRGGFHEISGRFSPDHGYGGVNATARFYRTLRTDRLVLAWRAMVDLLVGQPPFFELMKYGGLDPGFAPGGDSAVRGVPVQRYYGKVKLLSNLELRIKLFRLNVLRQRFVIGTIAFFDAGRVFSDYTARPDLDGRGLGLKLGLGGGARIQWGETVVVRTDVAWSPDARPVGVYLNINHIF